MSQNGPVPITPRDIREWREMTGTILRREECDILLDMDAAYRQAWHEEMASQNAARQDRQERSRPKTPMAMARRR